MPPNLQRFYIVGNFRRRSIGLWSAHLYLQLSSIHCLQCEIRSIRWLSILRQTYSCLSPSWYWFIPSHPRPSYDPPRAPRNRPKPSESSNALQRLPKALQRRAFYRSELPQGQEAPRRQCKRHWRPISRRLRFNTRLRLSAPIGAMRPSGAQRARRLADAREE